MSRLLNAVSYAERAHRGQTRKYTGEPYIVHPLEVAQIVSTAYNIEDMMVAALLHDVVEDTRFTLTDIDKAFGNEVSFMVWGLTDVSSKMDGNREVRKAKDRAHLATQDWRVHTIKLADLISNTRSITYHDQEFAKVYMKEKAELLKVLDKGHPSLYAQARGLVEEWFLEDKTPRKG